jgi:hypothetical protein
MPPRFLHVGFVFSVPLDLNRTLQIDNVMRTFGDDWVRYSATNWIVWTDKSADEIFQRIKPYIFGQEQVLVAAIDMNDRSGWLTPVLWQWMDAKPREPNKTLASILNALYPPPPTPQLNPLLPPPPFPWPPKT